MNLPVQNTNHEIRGKTGQQRRFQINTSIDQNISKCKNNGTEGQQTKNAKCNTMYPFGNTTFWFGSKSGEKKNSNRQCHVCPLQQRRDNT